jgi:anti-sigma B factor antagonist
MNPPMVQPSPKVEQSGSVRIITFTGDKVRDVENVIARELKGNVAGLADGHLLLDFTNVEYITAVELGTLVSLHKRMNASGGRLTLFNLNRHVFEVFTVTHLNELIGLCKEGGSL